MADTFTPWPELVNHWYKEVISRWDFSNAANRIYKESVMDYDFSGLCSDQIEKLEKRLESLQKSFIREYKISLNVINCPTSNSNRGEIMFDVESIFHDTAISVKSIYASSMNKIMAVLTRDL